MKKLKYAVMAGVLAVPCLFGLAGCGETEEEKIMNVSLNPEVEFVLDEDNKVVTVNALNDEGNFLIANANFTGKTAEQAVEIVIELSEENGFLVKGNQGENNIEIAISGETADKLYKSVKKVAEDTLDDLGISAVLNKVKLDKEYLQGLVAECMQELTESEIKALSEEDLIELIEDSREETANFYTQELKEFYYQTRAQEVRKAKLNEIKNVINQSGSQVISTLFATFTGYLDTVETEMANLTTTFQQQFLNAESTYNQMMQEFVAKKQSLLETRLSLGETLTADQQAQLTELENQVNTAITNLENAKTLALANIDSINTLINNAYASAEQTFTAIKQMLPSIFSGINDKVEDAMEDAEEAFLTEFNTDYSLYVGKTGDNSYWAKVTITKPNTNA